MDLGKVKEVVRRRERETVPVRIPVKDWPVRKPAKVPVRKEPAKVG